MPKAARLAPALLGGLVLWVAGTGAALAACCELAYLEVRSGDGDALRIDASELERSLSPPDLELLYWPAVNASTKTTERPPGDLGSAYAVTYFLRDAAGSPTVEVRETVYPDAPGGPVAVAPPDQTVSFRPGKGAPVPAGWRPFPEGAARELMTFVESRAEGPGWTSSRAVWLVLVAVAGWFTIRRDAARRLKPRRAEAQRTPR